MQKYFIPLNFLPEMFVMSWFKIHSFFQVESRFITMIDGDQYAMTNGMRGKPKWFVSNLATPLILLPTISPISRLTSKPHITGNLVLLEVRWFYVFSFLFAQLYLHKVKIFLHSISCPTIKI